CSHLISLPWYADHRDLLSFPTRRSSDLTFTASPALSCAAADGLGSGVGEAGAGVETVWFIGFALLFAFELSGPLDSQAVKSSDRDRKSTRLNSSHLGISYAVFCLKKKTS